MSNKWAIIVIGGFFSVAAYGWPWEPDVSKISVSAYINKERREQRRSMQDMEDEINFKHDKNMAQLLGRPQPSPPEPKFVIVTSLVINAANNTDFYINEIKAICSSYDAQGNRTFHGEIFFDSSPSIAPGNRLSSIIGRVVDDSSTRAECKVTGAKGSK